MVTVTGDREYLTWQAFGDAALQLADQVGEFAPDLILAIARGGLPLGTALAYALSVKDLRTVNVEFYTGVGATLAEPVLLSPAPSAADFDGRSVLIVDDVADSGRTLEFVHRLVTRHGAAVRTAVIYEKPQSAVRADYAWARTDRWVEFPWG